MISSADVKLWHLLAVANEAMCRRGCLHDKPCLRDRRPCPFGKTPPQTPSDPHCEGVTVEMWDEVLKEESEYDLLR